MKRSRILGLALAGCAAAGCLFRGPQVSEVRREPTLLLGYMDYQPRGDIGPFDHPAAIKAEELGRALTSIVFKEEKTFLSERPRKVFLDEEAGQLAPALSTLLAKATPQQTVYFAILREKGEAVSLFSRLTSGQLWVRDGKLQLVLGDLQREKVEAGPLDQKGTNFGHPGRDYRKNWAIQENSLVKRADRPGHPGEKRDSQVVIDLASLAGLAPAGSSAALPPVTAPAAAPVPAPAIAPAAGKADGAPLDQRLQKLKELYDKGLINDRDYSAKKEELLKGL